jgi:hypothetical protein
MQVVETERHLFLGKRIVTLPLAAHIKLVPLSTSHPIISHSCLLNFLHTFNLLRLLAAPLQLYAPWLRDLLVILLLPNYWLTRILGATLGRKRCRDNPFFDLWRCPDGLG